MKYRIIFSFDFFDSFKKNFISIERDSDQIKKKLKEDDWKIYQDHASPFFIKFMVFDVNNQSDFTLIICTKVKKKFLMFLIFCIPLITFS